MSPRLSGEKLASWVCGRASALEERLDAEALFSRRLMRLARSQSGTAAVEMAVVLPMLILLAIGVAEFGRIYVKSIAVANAATAGAQLGSLNSGYNDAAITQAARNDAGDQTLTVNPINRICRCPGSESAIDCTSSCAGYGVPQYFIEVTASKTISLILRYPGLPTSTTVRRMSAFRVQ